MLFYFVTYCEYRVAWIEAIVKQQQ